VTRNARRQRGDMRASLRRFSWLQTGSRKSPGAGGTVAGRTKELLAGIAAQGVHLYGRWDVQAQSVKSCIFERGW
jgi:hypothetical protein